MGLFSYDTLKIMDLSVDSVKLFAVLTVPGLVMMKTWELRTSTGPPDFLKQVAEVTAYGLLNLSLGYPILNWITESDSFEYPLFQWLGVFIYAVFLPVTIALGAAKARSSKFVRRYLRGPSPTPWDALFSRRIQCFVLIHLKGSTKLIGGYFGPNSEVSSFPAPQELYLEKVVKVTDDGIFESFPDLTYGILIKRDEIQYMEFFEEPEILTPDPQSAARTTMIFRLQLLMKYSTKFRLSWYWLPDPTNYRKPQGDFDSHGIE